MKLTIKINMDNAAFENDHELECVRILAEFVKDLENGLTLSIGDNYPLMDFNGNTVGSVNVST